MASRKESFRKIAGAEVTPASSPAGGRSRPQRRAGPGIRGGQRGQRDAHNKCPRKFCHYQVNMCDKNHRNSQKLCESHKMYWLGKHKSPCRNGDSCRFAHPDPSKFGVVVKAAAVPEPRPEPHAFRVVDAEQVVHKPAPLDSATNATLSSKHKSIFAAVEVTGNMLWGDIVPTTAPAAALAAAPHVVKPVVPSEVINVANKPRHDMSWVEDTHSFNAALIREKTLDNTANDVLLLAWLKELNVHESLHTKSAIELLNQVQHALGRSLISGMRPRQLYKEAVGELAAFLAANSEVYGVRGPLLPNQVIGHTRSKAGDAAAINPVSWMKFDDAVERMATMTYAERAWFLMTTQKEQKDSVIELLCIIRDAVKSHPVFSIMGPFWDTLIECIRQAFTKSCECGLPCTMEATWSNEAMSPVCRLKKTCGGKVDPKSPVFNQLCLRGQHAVHVCSNATAEGIVAYEDIRVYADAEESATKHGGLADLLEETLTKYKAALEAEERAEMCRVAVTTIQRIARGYVTRVVIERTAKAKVHLAAALAQPVLQRFVLRVTAKQQLSLLVRAAALQSVADANEMVAMDVVDDWEAAQDATERALQAVPDTFMATRVAAHRAAIAERDAAREAARDAAVAELAVQVPAAITIQRWFRSRATYLAFNLQVFNEWSAHMKGNSVPNMLVDSVYDTVLTTALTPFMAAANVAALVPRMVDTGMPPIPKLLTWLPPDSWSHVLRTVPVLMRLKHMQPEHRSLENLYQARVLAYNRLWYLVSCLV